MPAPKTTCIHNMYTKNKTNKNEENNPLRKLIVNYAGISISCWMLMHVYQTYKSCLFLLLTFCYSLFCCFVNCFVSIYFVALKFSSELKKSFKMYACLHFWHAQFNFVKEKKWIYYTQEILNLDWKTVRGCLIPIPLILLICMLTLAWCIAIFISPTIKYINRKRRYFSPNLFKENVY